MLKNKKRVKLRHRSRVPRPSEIHKDERRQHRSIAKIELKEDLRHE